MAGRRIELNWPTSRSRIIRLATGNFSLNDSLDSSDFSVARHGIKKGGYQLPGNRHQPKGNLV